MRKYIEVTGKTEEAAIAAALEKLGLKREDVSVEVLALAKTGFLGIGGTPAKIKVGYDVPDEAPAPVEIFKPAQPVKKPEPEKKAEPLKQPEPAKKAGGAKKTEAPKKAEKPTPVRREEKPAEPAKAVQEVSGDDPRAARIEEFLVGLLEHMDVKATPKIRVDEEGNYQVELVGSNLGAVIGRRGETLDAIQQLTGYTVNRGESKRVRVRIDAEGYRSKREDSLEKVARRTAEKVVRFRRNMTLEPMNAYERHVIHTALQNYPDVTTYSVGAEPNRRTVIAYAPGENR